MILWNELVYDYDSFFNKNMNDFLIENFEDYELERIKKVFFKARLKLRKCKTLMSKKLRVDKPSIFSDDNNTKRFKLI